MTLQFVHLLVWTFGVLLGNCGVFLPRARQLRAGRNGKLASVYLERHELERNIGNGNHRQHGDTAVSCFGFWYQPCSSLFHIPHPFQGRLSRSAELNKKEHPYRVVKGLTISSNKKFEENSLCMSLLHLLPKINLMKIGFQESTVLTHPHETKEDCDQSRSVNLQFSSEE